MDEVLQLSLILPVLALHLGCLCVACSEALVAAVVVRDGLGQSPMFRACEGGDLEVCEWLRQHGAAQDVTRADNYGHTPMSRACHGGHVEVCERLRQHGAAEDVARADNDGETPMFIACSNRRVPVCQWLLRVGGPALLDDDRARQHMTPDLRDELLAWARDPLAERDAFTRVVLFGMHRSSGSAHLRLMGGGGAQVNARRLVAEFGGVELDGAGAGRVREAAAVLAGM